jgi:hypothetical protein
VKTSLFFRWLSRFPFSRQPVVVLVVIVLLTWRNGYSFGPQGPPPPLRGIHETAENGDLEKVKVLLKNNPDWVFSKDPELQRTPLFYAADADHENVVEFLLDNKAEVNAKDVSGLEPMTHEESKEHFDKLRRNGSRGRMYLYLGLACNMGGLAIIQVAHVWNGDRSHLLFFEFLTGFTLYLAVCAWRNRPC